MHSLEWDLNPRDLIQISLWLRTSNNFAFTTAQCNKCLKYVTTFSNFDSKSPAERFGALWGIKDLTWRDRKDEGRIIQIQGPRNKRQQPIQLGLKPEMQQVVEEVILGTRSTEK